MKYGHDDFLRTMCITDADNYLSLTYEHMYNLTVNADLNFTATHVALGPYFCVNQEPMPLCVASKFGRRLSPRGYLLV